MISYSSGRARVSFDPPETVLFVNKRNRKTDAACEGNANVVCKLPSGEEDGEAKL
ncbi:hypothetical protein [uncultured Rikenella sp.]|uniref:hypothetical protein n=1 Tax=uncultured Rikenella sp. TaxID=368003 RepID=UPI00272BB747|nr:hypothetical protein [uncultured Rikenella sp.]